MWNLSQASAPEESVIHHVDSTLGLLLAIVIFLTGLAFNIMQPSLGVSFAPGAIRSALAIACATVLWLIGVLRQVWFAKLMAWALATYSLLMPALTLLIIYSVLSFGAVAPSYLLGFNLIGACVGSSLFVWYVVRRSYLIRLSLEPDLRALRDRIHQYGRIVAWAVSVIGFILYLTLVLG